MASLPTFLAITTTGPRRPPADRFNGIEASYVDLRAAPPERRDLSPLTGWTRAHWEWTADLLLDGVRPFASPGHAFFHLPGRAGRHGRVMDGLEGFSRTFLLAAFRLAGAGGEARGELAERYGAGLSAGTDPVSREAWPPIERLSHSMVDAAAIAVSLFETRPWIWNQLADREQQRLAAWLGAVRGEHCYPNNWRLFPVVVHAFLKSVGAPYRQDEIDRNLDWIDDLHRGGGWYADGRKEQFDHYAGWAFQFYLPLWCRIDGDGSDPARAGRVRERLARFLDDYRHLFGADGAPVFHGRSLTYRFAAAAPFWAGALTGATPLSPGETRRLATGALRYFVGRGAIEDGVLSRGWHRRFEPMLQSYSGPASPYWACAGFLGLLLPPEHEAWTAREEPLAVERGDFSRAMPAPGFLAWGTRTDGIVRLASHRSNAHPLPGGRTADPHYGKLCYSTHTAPDMPAAAKGLAGDSEVCLLDSSGAGASRARFRTVAVADGFAASAYHPGEAQNGRRPPAHRRRPRVETASVVCDAAELRVHLVRAREPGSVRDGGFAIADSRPLAVSAGDRWRAVQRRDGLTSLIAALHGFERAEVCHQEAANAFGRHSAAPLLFGPHPGGERVYASLVLLSAAAVDPEDAAHAVASIAVHGRRVLVGCRNGERLLVQLGRPRRIRLELAGRDIAGRVRFVRVAPDGSSLVVAR